jgi:hypothetical protein
MKRSALPWIIGLGIILASGITAWITGIWKWQKGSWEPSLVFNLLTTGLAILLVNVMIAGTERRLEKHRKDEAAKKEKDAAAVRKARTALRRARRKKGRSEFLGFQSYWPILVCLSAGDDVLLAGEFGDLNAVKAVLKNKAPEYRRQAAWLRHLTLLYSRYFNAKELSWLHQLERSLDSLALGIEIGVSPEMEVIGIMTSLEGMESSSRALFQSFGLPLVLDDVDKFSKRVGELSRKWGVPEIRKKMKETLAPLFEVKEPEIARMLRGQAKPDDSPES